MYPPSERAGVFGWYLLGPLLGPTIGPLIGGIILQNLEWPWLFWILLMICGVVFAGVYFFLHETYVPILLAHRKKELEDCSDVKYYFEGEDLRRFPLVRGLRGCQVYWTHSNMRHKTSGL